jgi:zinc protease
MKRTMVGIISLLFAGALSLPAQLDRSKVPPPGPAPAAAFPDYDLLTLSNGIRLIIVKNTELPTIQMRLLIDRKPILEGEFAGYIDIAGQLMRQGTVKRSKDQLDKEVDLIGASLGASGTAVYGGGLSKYTEKLFELFSDLVLHPSFPQEELDKLKDQSISGIKYRKTEPNAIVNVVRQRLLYSDKHPYGEIETEESIKKITRNKCLEMYNTYYKPNHAIMAVVGDVDKKNIVVLMNKYFGTWKRGPLPEPVFESPKPIEKTTVALVDRAISVQSVIRVTQIVDLPRTSPDVPSVEVMNTILGGGIFRLFVNLREKHAYTYGAYSSLGPDELIGNFTASTSVRNTVTDSALTEIFYELRRMGKDPVEQKELQMAKNYLSGNFVRSLENGATIAEYAINLERFKLPKDYYKTYLKRVDAVTAAEVQKAAQKYIQPDKMYIVAVGAAKDVKDKLAAFGTVKMYDEDGNVIVPTETPVTMTSDQIIDSYFEKIGGKAKVGAMKDKTMELSASMQGINLRIKNSHKSPNKVYSETAMNGSVQQRMGFDGDKGWAASAQGIMDLSGDMLESLKSESTFNLLYDYKTLGYTDSVGGIKQVKGKDCYEIVLTSKAGDATKHYFGKDDFLKYRELQTAKTPMGPMEQSIDMSEYKDFNGLLFPAKYEQSAMGRSLEMKVEKFEYNTNLSDSLFVKPAK